MSLIHYGCKSFSDCDRLFYSVCEKKAIAKESILPSLWTYRSRITLEHLLQMVKNQRTCPVLLEFLNEASSPQ